MSRCIKAQLIGLFELFYGAVIMAALANGGDRLRQEPERSSRCMPGYLMQLVKTRRETQLPITNWLSLPNKHRASRRKLLMRAE